MAHLLERHPGIVPMHAGIGKLLLSLMYQNKGHRKALVLITLQESGEASAS